MINLKSLSPEKLREVYSILKVIVDHFETDDLHSKFNKISMNKFGVMNEVDVTNVLKSIPNTNVLNDSYRRKFAGFRDVHADPQKSIDRIMRKDNFSEDDLQTYLFISFKDKKTLGKIKEFKKEIDKILPSEIFYQDEKMTVCINKKDGIYLKQNDEKRYEIRGKRLELVSCFIENPFIRLSSLQAVGYKTEPDTLKAINKINSVFRSKLGILHDLIVHSRSSGYRLNSEKYNFDFT